MDSSQGSLALTHFDQLSSDYSTLLYFLPGCNDTIEDVEELKEELCLRQGSSDNAKVSFKYNR